jgi:DNA helicase-2/ATP-dependent DNA helicase PcrA
MMADRIGYQPTKVQQEVMKFGVGNLVISAPPGCGKTEVLALRAKGLIEAGLVQSPRRILAVTFTNRARDNISSRMLAILGTRIFHSHITVTNFHGLAARVYRAHAQSIGHDVDRMVPPQKSWLDRVLNQHSTDSSEKYAAKKLLNDLKRLPMTDEELRHAILVSKNTLALSVEEERVAEGRLDYGDLLRLAQVILKNDLVARLYRLHFAHVLVDEYQDLTLQQLALILAISQDNLTFAGDPGQAIYSFAGADLQSVQAKIACIAPAAKKLDECHRSSPAVLRAVNLVSGWLDLDAVRCANPKKWKKNGVFQAWEFDHVSDEASRVKLAASRILSHRVDSTIGVITRADARRADLDHVFAEGFEWPVKNWKAAISSASTAAVLRQILDGLNADRSLDDMSRLDRLIQETVTIVGPADVDSVDELYSCYEWLRAQVLDGAELHKALEGVEISSDSSDPIPSGVHLLNAHVGKGQQFDWVFVCGFEQGSIPSHHAKSDGDLEEEARVLRVMLSRAKQGVFVTRSKHIRGSYGPWNRPASPWWSSMIESADPLDI